MQSKFVKHCSGGICPITDKKVISSNSVISILSLMFSCGMYNYSGEFAFKVGLPAKSGVSGALVIVVPNVMSVRYLMKPRVHSSDTTKHH